MKAGQAPSIFDSFNARALRPEQVAKTFVTSDAYDRLSKRRNTVIVGPRGSGKTTLLKMLQSPALETWDHGLADSYCKRIDFTGVFVATDVSWSEQLQSLGEDDVEPKVQQLLSIAAFTTHTLRSLVVAMLYRIEESAVGNTLRSFRRARFALNEEAELARSLRTAWHLPQAIPTLLSIKHSLIKRLSEIREIVSREKILGESGRPQRLADIPFLHLDFIQAAAIAVEQFNDLASEPGAKWALMFDELELAPSWIRNGLLKSLRSGAEEFLFKLAMSPSAPDIHIFEGALAAVPDQDFDQIALWYAEKNDGYRFCESLWHSMLSDRGFPPSEPRDVLGRSEFETLSDEWVSEGTAYMPGSRLGKRFIRMAAKDSSFKDYLTDRDIDVRRLDRIDGEQRAADLRKVAPLLAVREFYRVRGNKRGRKSAILYAGADSIFAISEGNPRWFIALVGRLLDNYGQGTKKITASSQAKELQNAAERFAAMLRTIPAPAIGARGLLSLVKTVGIFFHEEAIAKGFNPDPPGTFVVDSRSSDEVNNALERALNAGAIVYVPDDVSQILLRTLRGKRFRISYLLAPLYGLPLRLGREVALAGILSKADKRQMDLLGEQE